jgi:hypothetical protein
VVRTAILGAALVMIAVLASLTVAAVIASGVTVLTFVSLLVLALLGFGVGGALMRRPPTG